MQPFLTTLMIFALAGPADRAGEPPAAEAPRSDGSFAAVKKEWDDASKTYRAEFAAAFAAAKKKGEAAAKAFIFEKTDPSTAFSPRFLAIVEKNPEGPDAVEALKLTLQTSVGPKVKPMETQTKAIKIIRDHYVSKPQITSLLGVLLLVDDDVLTRLVDEIVARNPDRKVHVAAYKYLITRRESQSRTAEALEKNPKSRARMEQHVGKEKTDAMIARGPKAKAELDGLRQKIRTEYGDLVANLSIGSVAPEIKTQTIDGKSASLDALKGNVVVLDFWSTRCVPCIAMIPHEREMVTRLAAKPFVLVSISTDEKKEALTDFLSREKMPWTQWWWNATDAGAVEAWDVQYLPTIYVIDAQGVIRHKNLRGEKLEAAVNVLLKEMETKKTAAQ